MCTDRPSYLVRGNEGHSGTAPVVSVSLIFTLVHFPFYPEGTKFIFADVERQIGLQLISDRPSIDFIKFSLMT